MTSARVIVIFLVLAWPQNTMFSQSLFETPLMTALKISDPAMRVYLAEEQTAELTDNLQRQSDLPMASVSILPTVAGQETDKLTGGGSSTISLSQSLPWGGSTTLSSNQSANLSFSNSDWTFDVGITMSGLHPLVSPEKVLQFRRATRLWTTTEHTSRTKQNQRLRLAEVVGEIGSLAVAKSLADLLAQRDRFFEEQRLADEALWRAGKMSFITLSENDTTRALANRESFNVSASLIGLEASFLATGLGQEWIPSSPERFVSEWESYVMGSSVEDSSRLLAIASYELETASIARASVETALNLTWNLNLKPTKLAGASDFGAELLSSRWNWTLSIGLTVPASPWDPSYQTEVSTRARLIRAQANFEMSQRQLDQRDTIRPQELSLLQAVLRESERQEKIQLDRAEMAAGLLATGRGNSLDLQLQTIALKRAHLDAISARLNIVLFYLRGL